jgi:membrane protease YdiL (CAAX protease family)
MAENTIGYASPVLGHGTKLARTGGAIGIAGTFIGLAIFMGGCMGVHMSFALSPICLILGLVGLPISIVGGVMKKDPAIEDTHVLAAILINVGVIAGAFLEIMIWRGWPMFAGGS